MFIGGIFFTNNLVKKIKLGNISKSKKKFLELKKEYENAKLPLLSTFEKSYQADYSSRLIRILKKKKNIVLVGMGGSILGAKALYSFLKHKIKKTFFFYDNLSEQNISELNKKKLNKSALIFISKSGNTIETLSNFIALRISATWQVI